MGREPTVVRCMQLPSSELAPHRARRFVRAQLAASEPDGLGALAELLASELVTNVVRHVGSPMTVSVTRDGPTIRVEVTDDSDDVPELTHPDGETNHGRGLLLVDALASAWGSYGCEVGKTVWFALGDDRTEEIGLGRRE